MYEVNIALFSIFATFAEVGGVFFFRNLVFFKDRTNGPRSWKFTNDFMVCIDVQVKISTVCSLILFFKSNSTPKNFLIIKKYLQGKNLVNQKQIKTIKKTKKTKAETCDEK